MRGQEWQGHAKSKKELCKAGIVWGQLLQDSLETAGGNLLLTSWGRLPGWSHLEGKQWRVHPHLQTVVQDVPSPSNTGTIWHTDDKRETGDESEMKFQCTLLVDTAVWMQQLGLLGHQYLSASTGHKRQMRWDFSTASLQFLLPSVSEEWPFVYN